ncbi:hypothetical protein MHYP_G00166560 [Metynnis hypsauchen]
MVACTSAYWFLMKSCCPAGPLWTGVITASACPPLRATILLAPPQTNRKVRRIRGHESEEINCNFKTKAAAHAFAPPIGLALPTFLHHEANDDNVKSFDPWGLCGGRPAMPPPFSPRSRADPGCDLLTADQPSLCVPNTGDIWHKQAACD